MRVERAREAYDARFIRQRDAQLLAAAAAAVAPPAAPPPLPESLHLRKRKGAVVRVTVGCEDGPPVPTVDSALIALADAPGARKRARAAAEAALEAAAAAAALSTATAAPAPGLVARGRRNSSAPTADTTPAVPRPRAIRHRVEDTEPHSGGDPSWDPIPPTRSSAARPESRVSVLHILRTAVRHQTMVRPASCTTDEEYAPPVYHPPTSLARVAEALADSSDSDNDGDGDGTRAAEALANSSDSDDDCDGDVDEVFSATSDTSHDTSSSSTVAKPKDTRVAVATAPSNLSVAKDRLRTGAHQNGDGNSSNATDASLSTCAYLEQQQAARLQMSTVCVVNAVNLRSGSEERSQGDDSVTDDNGVEDGTEPDESESDKKMVTGQDMMDEEDGSENGGQLRDDDDDSDAQPAIDIVQFDVNRATASKELDSTVMVCGRNEGGRVVNSQPIVGPINTSRAGPSSRGSLMPTAGDADAESLNEASPPGEIGEFSFSRFLEHASSDDASSTGDSSDWQAEDDEVFGAIGDDSSIEFDESDDDEIDSRSGAELATALVPEALANTKTVASTNHGIAQPLDAMHAGVALLSHAKRAATSPGLLHAAQQQAGLPEPATAAAAPSILQEPRSTATNIVEPLTATTSALAQSADHADAHLPAALQWRAVVYGAAAAVAPPPQTKPNAQRPAQAAAAIAGAAVGAPRPKTWVAYVDTGFKLSSLFGEMLPLPAGTSSVTVTDTDKIANVPISAPVTKDASASTMASNAAEPSAVTRPLGRPRADKKQQKNKKKLKKNTGPHVMESNDGYEDDGVNAGDALAIPLPSNIVPFNTSMSEGGGATTFTAAVHPPPPSKPTPTGNDKTQAPFRGGLRGRGAMRGARTGNRGRPAYGSKPAFPARAPISTTVDLAAAAARFGGGFGSVAGAAPLAGTARAVLKDDFRRKLRGARR